MTYNAYYPYYNYDQNYYGYFYRNAYNGAPYGYDRGSDYTGYYPQYAYPHNNAYYGTPGYGYAQGYNKAPFYPQYGYPYGNQVAYNAERYGNYAYGAPYTDDYGYKYDRENTQEGYAPQHRYAYGKEEYQGNYYNNFPSNDYKFYDNDSEYVLEYYPRDKKAKYDITIVGYELRLRCKEDVGNYPERYWSYYLPKDIDPGKVRASYKEDKLYVYVPKHMDIVKSIYTVKAS